MFVWVLCLCLCLLGSVSVCMSHSCRCLLISRLVCVDMSVGHSVFVYDCVGMSVFV